MKEVSQTRFALLGLLHLYAMSGYDLKKLADESIGHFWREGWGRIYPTLRTLEAEGLIALKVESGRRGRERKVYALRPAGRAVLREWLAQDWTPQVYRNELLLKLFFARNASPTVARRHVERLRSQCATEVATYEMVLHRIEQFGAKGYPDADFWRMTVSYGLHSKRAELAWAEETLSVLKRQKQNDPELAERKRRRGK